MPTYDRNQQAFQPLLGPNNSTAYIDAAATGSASIALPQLPGIGGAGNPAQSVDQATTFAILNTGSVMVFVAFGGSGVAAVVPTGAGADTGSYPVPPNEYGGVTIITVPGNPGYMAAIAASSTAGVYVTPGYGLV